MTTIKTLIVDDHTLFAQALSSALKSRGLQVVGIAVNGSDAIEMAVREQPHIVLMDVSLPDGDGITVATDIIASLPDCRIIVLTAHDDVHARREAGRAGLHGYLLKGTSLSELVTSIGSVRDGLIVFQPLSVPGGRASARAYREHDDPLLGLLTAREREVLTLLGEALGSRQIADRLNLSLSTVRTHIQTILEKLSVHSRLEAVALANRLTTVNRAS